MDLQNKAAPREVSITYVFDAPRELVFKAWTDPKHIAQWWGPEYFTNPVVEMDVRPGGKFVIHMMAPDGTMYPTSGVFNEIVPPERIVFTDGAFEDEHGNNQLEALSTVTFTEAEGKTTIILHTVVTKSNPEVEEPLAGMEQGWMESFHKLAAYLPTI